MKRASRPEDGSDDLDSTLENTLRSMISLNKCQKYFISSMGSYRPKIKKNKKSKC